MMSIAAMAAGNDKYYTRLAQESYYLEGGEEPGRWWGKGAEKLGLTGRVSPEALGAMFRGFSPDGSALVQNAGKENRQPGWSCAYSPPKPVSIAYVFGNDEQRKDIEESIRVAVESGLGYVQDEVAVSRSGRAGKHRVKADLVVALFFHVTSREGDPQLHVHALILNVCVRPDLTTGTLVSRPLYEHKMVGGALFRATLAAELQRRLNLAIVRTDKSFGIEGVPDELVRQFSKRRSQIEERLAQRNEHSAKAAAVAALDTRRSKTDTLPREELIKCWRAEAASIGFEKIEAFDRQRTRHSGDPKPDLYRLIGEAIKDRADQSGHFDRAWLLKRVATESFEHGFDANTIRKGVDRWTWGQPGLLQLFQTMKRFAIRRAFRVEKRAIRLAHKLQAAGVHGADSETVSAALSRHSKPRNDLRETGFQHIRQLVRAAGKRRSNAAPSKTHKQMARRTLTAEERSIVRQIAGKKRGSLRLIQCKRGKGRMQVLRASREILEKAGYRVIVSAPSRRDATALGQFVGAESFSLGSLEHQLRPSTAAQINRAGKQLRNVIKGRANRRRKPLMDRKTAIFIDKASLINTRRFKLLMKAAKAAGALVVLVDQAARWKNPFGMFRTLIAKQKAVEPEQERTAKVSRIRFYSHAVSEETMLFDWFGCQGRHDGTAIILSDGIEAASRANRLCQAERIRLGELRGKCITCGDRKFYEGDRVYFSAAARTLGISGGETGVIVRLRPAKQTVVIRLDGGGHIAVPLSDCPQLHHGYAIPVGARHQRQLSDVFSLGEANRGLFADTVGPNDVPNVRTYLTDETQQQDRKQTACVFEKAQSHRQEQRL